MIDSNNIFINILILQLTKYDDNDTDKHSRPVTVIFKRIAKKNKTKEFEEWLSRYKYEYELKCHL